MARKRFLLPALLLLAVASFASVRTVVVQGPSMQPTLRSGQPILVLKGIGMLSGIHDGDIVIIADESKSHFIVKRVFRTGGEVVNPCLKPADAAWNPNGFMVPENSIYVLGDNLAVSEDSRLFGPVPISRVVGKAIVY